MHAMSSRMAPKNAIYKTKCRRVQGGPLTTVLSAHTDHTHREFTTERETGALNHGRIGEARKREGSEEGGGEEPLSEPYASAETARDEKTRACFCSEFGFQRLISAHFAYLFQHATRNTQRNLNQKNKASQQAARLVIMNYINYHSKSPPKKKKKKDAQRFNGERFNASN